MRIVQYYSHLNGLEYLMVHHPGLEISTTFALLLVATVISHRRFQKRYNAMTPEERDEFDAWMQTW